MKVLSSLKSAKARHRDCKVVRRRGKIFVICKSNPRFKARQLSLIAFRLRLALRGPTDVRNRLRAVLFMRLFPAVLL